MSLYKHFVSVLEGGSATPGNKSKYDLSRVTGNHNKNLLSVQEPCWMHQYVVAQPDILSNSKNQMFLVGMFT